MPYIAAHRATARDWARRFWQGSHDHRGTIDAPGRVLTLVPIPNALCEGRVFGIAAENMEQTLIDLDHREKNGYERQNLIVQTESLGAIEALTYIAPKNNIAWLGEANTCEIAEQIICAHGPSGSNKDYVLELHSALQNDAIDDEHVNAIAQRLKCMSD